MEHTDLTETNLVKAIEENSIEMLEAMDNITVSVQNKPMVKAIIKHYPNDAISFLRMKNPLLDSYLKIKFKEK